VSNIKQLNVQLLSHVLQWLHQNALDNFRDNIQKNALTKFYFKKQRGSSQDHATLWTACRDIAGRSPVPSRWSHWHMRMIANVESDPHSSSLSATRVVWDVAVGISLHEAHWGTWIHALGSRNGGSCAEQVQQLQQVFVCQKRDVPVHTVQTSNTANTTSCWCAHGTGLIACFYIFLPWRRFQLGETSCGPSFAPVAGKYDEGQRGQPLIPNVSHCFLSVRRGCPIKHVTCQQNSTNVE
jgi:NADH:ubiquinone oxidoreductase subunit